MESVLLSIQLLYVWCTKSIAQVGCWKNPCAHTCYCCYIANQTGCRCPMELSQFYNYGPSCSLGVIFPHTYLWYQIKDSVCLHWGRRISIMLEIVCLALDPILLHMSYIQWTHYLYPHPMTPSFTFKRNFHVLCAQLKNYNNSSKIWNIWLEITFCTLIAPYILKAQTKKDPPFWAHI